MIMLIKKLFTVPGIVFETITIVTPFVLAAITYQLGILLTEYLFKFSNQSFHYLSLLEPIYNNPKQESHKILQ